MTCLHGGCGAGLVRIRCRRGCRLLCNVVWGGRQQNLAV